jgi:transcriptional regulator with XRE-family HTH domain
MNERLDLGVPPSGKDILAHDPAPAADGAVEYRTVDLAKLVRDARSRTGLSQERIAEKAGVSAGYIAHIETGRTRKPDRRVLHRIAKALETEVGPLLDAAGYTDEDQERFMAVLADDKNLKPREKQILREMYLSWIAPSDG